jgi:hypothetical protein
MVSIPRPCLCTPSSFPTMPKVHRHHSRYSFYADRLPASMKSSCWCSLTGQNSRDHQIQNFHERPQPLQLSRDKQIQAIKHNFCGVLLSRLMVGWTCWPLGLASDRQQSTWALSTHASCFAGEVTFHAAKHCLADLELRRSATCVVDDLPETF